MKTRTPSLDLSLCSSPPRLAKMRHRLHHPLAAAVAGASVLMAGTALAQYKVPDPDSVIDLSPTVSMSLQQSWPGGQRHHQPIIIPYIEHGDSPLSADLLIVDNDTATQFDCPPHMMADQSTGLPNSGYWGFMTCDEVPVWQMMGRVFKVDGREIYDQASDGESPIFSADMVKQAERAAGQEIGPGDAVLFWSGFNNTRSASGEPPERLQTEVLEGKSPAWPGPDFAATDYVGSKGVRTIGLDSPSIGPFGESDYTYEGPQSYRSQTPKAIETHLGVFKHGSIDVEGLVNLDQVPNGSIFFGLPVKIQDTPTAQARAAAITDLELAEDLARAIKAQRVVDLSVLNGDRLPVYWLGEGVGNHAFPFMRIEGMVDYRDYAPYHSNSQIMDSRTGTHITPPAHYGLPNGFSVDDYAPDIQQWASEFEASYGTLQTTEVTSDKVPVQQMMGPARVIDVRHLVGTTSADSWPASPAISVADVQAHETRHGAFTAGEVVVFQTGHTDTHFGPMLRGRLERTLKAPLDGQIEGWPAVSPEVVAYLADKGIKHIAIDAPSAGSVDPKLRAMTYWQAANEEVIFTEYLTGVGQMPATGAFYVFLNPKFEDNHGGPGRAIGILPMASADASSEATESD